MVGKSPVVKYFPTTFFGCAAQLTQKNKNTKGIDNFFLSDKIWLRDDQRLINGFEGPHFPVFARKQSSYRLQTVLRSYDNCRYQAIALKTPTKDLPWIS
jgi:hypothetical protein